jgi:hypothetical protein
MDERDFWELKFSVEVSTRYHDWRRSTMMTMIRLVKGVTFFSAIFTLVTAFDPFHWGSAAVWVVACFSAVIAGVNLLELVADFDGKALLHETLYKSFKRLQERIARDSADWMAHLPEWEADAQAIRVDEPPTWWAVYAMCWNQTIERYYQTEMKRYMRPVAYWQLLLRNIVHFRPRDFPATG